MVLRYIKHIVIYLVMILFGILGGDSCNLHLKIHESGYASYSGYSCTVLNSADKDTYGTLLKWCSDQHSNAADAAR